MVPTQATKLLLPELVVNGLRDSLTKSKWKGEDHYIYDCPMLMHICWNPQFLAPRWLLGHPGNWVYMLTL